MPSPIPPRSTQRPTASDTPNEDESLLDEALEETFPASDPISPSAAEKADSAAEKEARERREREREQAQARERDAGKPGKDGGER